MKHEKDRPERLKELIFRLGLNGSQFSKEIGIKNVENLYRVLHGQNLLSIKIIDKIHHSFPDVNIMWLLYGDGNIFKAGDDLNDIEQLRKRVIIQNEIIKEYERKDKSNNGKGEDHNNGNS
jgi:predicted transcriptional regulator